MGSLIAQMYPPIVADDTTFVASGRETTRVWIVRLVFLVYLLLLFEGVLRKWLLPEFQKLLFFIRDPFVLVIYALALNHGFLRLNGWLISGSLIFGLSLLTVGPLLSGPEGLLILGYGIRNYFFYLPLMFVIERCLKSPDLRQLVRFSLLLAIPLAGLAFVQHQMPPSHWVNQSFTGEEGVFTAGERVRTYGTFTFTVGQVYYGASLTAMLLAVWVQPKRYRIGRLELLAATAAVIVIALTSGSRAIYGFLAAIATASLALSFLSRDSSVRLRALWVPVLIGTAGAVMFVSLLATAFEAMQSRFEAASAVEAIELNQSYASVLLARYFSSLTEAFFVTTEAPALGYGIGMGTLGGSFLASGTMAFLLAEQEWPRVILELGPAA